MKIPNLLRLLLTHRRIGIVSFALLAALGALPPTLPAQGNPSPGAKRSADEAEEAVTAKFGDGWFAEERTPVGPFRWMGATSVIEVVAKHAGTLVIRGQIRSFVTENGAELSMDDKAVQPVKVLGPDWQEYLVRIPISAGTHRLSLRSRKEGIKPPGDNRALTICLQNFQAGLEP